MSATRTTKATRLPRVLPTIAALLVLIAVSCSGDDKPATTVTPAESDSDAGSAVAPATQVPTVSLTPRAGVDVDLTTARQLEAQGNIEAAAEIYIAGVAQGSGDNYDEVVLSAARLLLELERPEDAATLLEPYLTSAHPLPAAHYLLARSYTAQERWQEALGEYDRYIELDGPATPYAYLDRTVPLLELDRPMDAATSAQNGIAYDLPAGAVGRFRTTIAQSYERAGYLTDAINWYQQLFDRGSVLDRTFALQRMVALKQQLGDPSAEDDLQTLLADYPASPEALDELSAALNRGDDVLPTVRGLIYYRHNDYTSAEPEFLEQIDLEPESTNSAEAYYYLAAIQESHGEIDSALANYAIATTLNPDSFIADDALWWRALIRETQGDLETAQTLLQRITDEYPNSSWAPQAAFRLGMLSYVNQDYAAAAASWGEAAADSTDERLDYWQAKALLLAGRDTEARDILQNLAYYYEDDYYGIRAVSLLNGSQGQPLAVVEPNVDLEPDFDWEAAEAWLSQWTSQAVIEAGWPDDPRWLRATELRIVGRDEQADSEALDLMESYASDPIAMYTMARRLQAQGRTGTSARAGQRLLRALKANPNQGLPRALMSLSYPPAFGRETADLAESEGVSPLLLLAFIRQESFFDPRAVSPAGALGLTQLLPSTAEPVAEHFGVSPFDPDQLLHADLSLQFGAYHMARQIEDFGGEIMVAFAAYNGGATNASRWRTAPGADDADVYLEAVEFNETRLYLQIVAENYAIYRYLYAGEPQPDLPD